MAGAKANGNGKVSLRQSSGAGMRTAASRRAASPMALLLGHALLDELGRDLVQPHAALVGEGVDLAHEVAVQLHGEGHEAHLAIALTLLALVHGSGGVPAEAVGNAGGPADAAALEFFEVGFFHRDIMRHEARLEAMPVRRGEVPRFYLAPGLPASASYDCRSGSAASSRATGADWAQARRSTPPRAPLLRR